MRWVVVVRCDEKKMTRLNSLVVLLRLTSTKYGMGERKKIQLDCVVVASVGLVPPSSSWLPLTHHFFHAVVERLSEVSKRTHSTDRDTQNQMGGRRSHLEPCKGGGERKRRLCATESLESSSAYCYSV